MHRLVVLALTIASVQSHLNADEIRTSQPVILALASTNETQLVLSTTRDKVFNAGEVERLIARFPADAVPVVLTRSENDEYWTVQDRLSRTVDGLYQSTLRFSNRGEASVRYQVVVLKANVDDHIAGLRRGTQLTEIPSDIERSGVLHVRRRGNVSRYSALDTGRIVR